MRLALIIDDYVPYSSRIGAQMFADLAHTLSQMGEDVVVITPTPLPSAPRFEHTRGNEISVWRFRSGAIKNVALGIRLMNENLLSYRSWRVIAQIVQERPFDGVVYYSPSIFWSHLVNKIKSIAPCRTYLVLRDIFPQWLVDIGTLREKSLLTRYLRYCEQKNYAAADWIGVMSANNLQFFRQTYPEYHHVEVLPNWISPASVPSPLPYWRRKLQLENKVILLYGGNIGLAQDMTNLLRLARALHDCPQAHLLFVGHGSAVDTIRALIKQWKLTNVSYHASVSQKEYNALLQEVDIGLFSLDAAHKTHNFPGKLLGYFSAALPVLGSINAGNDLMPLINDHRAGYVFENGNDAQFIATARRLIADSALRTDMGVRGQQLLEKYFSVQSVAEQILRRLHSN